MFNAPARFRRLLGGNASAQRTWLEERSWRWAGVCVLVIVIGGGLYGATLGLWRDGWQAVFTAIKFPLLVFLTCGGNAALNGCLGQLLGSGMGFRQTTLAILMSFSVTAMVLAAIAPIMLFLLWNTPSLAAGNGIGGHNVTLLAHVGVIAFAGIIGVRRLFRLVVVTSGSAAVARRVLFGWLAGALLLGTQLAWVLRPFIGSPGLAVEFFRPDPLHGNFFQAVWRAIHHLL
ncbi:MAG TPA: hypothetical protein VIM61_14770 [Chthoniobacterales bacterium]